MLSFFKQKQPNEHLTRIKNKIQSTQDNFEKRLIEIENFANSLYRKTEIYEDKINRFKNFCHNINILITDKNKDLKLIFANHTVCEKLYGLPNICSELIENRYEWDVINDFIEKTGKWNSFVECSNFNIDEFVQYENKEMKFIQMGFINDKRMILKTTLKPHIKNDEFDGIMTISNIIDVKEFKESVNRSKLLYNKNEYYVWERLK